MGRSHGFTLSVVVYSLTIYTREPVQFCTDKKLKNGERTDVSRFEVSHPASQPASYPAHPVRQLASQPAASHPATQSVRHPVSQQAIQISSRSLRPKDFNKNLAEPRSATPWIDENGEQCMTKRNVSVCGASIIMCVTFREA